MEPTRQRILTEAMRLFGGQGFAATSVAQIEAAAGLRAGSGGLYRHFPSKRHVLEAGIRERVDARDDLLDLLEQHTLPDDVRQRLYAVAVAGLKRLDAERDLSRVLVRDLRDFPDLLELFRERELERNHIALAALLAAAGGTDDDGAVAAVLIDAASHYWLMRDLYGGKHPLSIPQERYFAVLADMAARMLNKEEP